MGNNCCSYNDKLTDSNAENTYREVLNEFPKIHFYDLLEELDKCKIENNIREEAVFSEHLYNKFKQKLILNSKYKIIHKDLIPDWTDAWELVYHEDLLANLLVWEFCFNNDRIDIKYQIIEEISVIIEKVLEVNFFVDFIGKYLYLNLIKINSMYINSLKRIIKANIHQISIFGNSIDLELLHETEKTFNKLAKKEHFKAFLEEIEFNIHKIYFIDTDIEINHVNNSQKPFTKEMFVDFYSKFNFIFNIISLRNAYYKFVFKDESQIEYHTTSESK